MKQSRLVSILFAVSIFTIIVSAASTPLKAATENYRFKMWIAPIECTRNEVSDGVTTNVILTPEQCDDLLHPPTKPHPAKPTKPAPSAPDTGKFSDIWTSVGMASILSIFGVSIVVLIIHDRKNQQRGSLQKKRQ